MVKTAVQVSLVTKYAGGKAPIQQQQPKNNSFNEQNSERQMQESHKFQQRVKQRQEVEQQHEYDRLQVQKNTQRIDNPQSDIAWLSTSDHPEKRIGSKKSEIKASRDRDGVARISGMARNTLDTTVRSNDVSNAQNKGTAKFDKEKGNMRGANTITGKTAAANRTKTMDSAANKRSNGEADCGQREAKKQRPSASLRKEIPGEIIDLACDASSDSEAEREEVEKVRTAKGILFLNHLISQEAELLKVPPVFSPGILYRILTLRFYPHELFLLNALQRNHKMVNELCGLKIRTCLY